MNDRAPDSSDSAAERIEQEAAAWVLRDDRGLTPTEQDVFLDWLSADPRHGEAIARHRRHWQRLNQLANWRPEHGTRPNPDLLAAPLHRRVVTFFPRSARVALAAAAVLAVGLGAWLAVSWNDGGNDPLLANAVAPASTLQLASNQRVLEDGTVVELNADAAISVHYTPTERRVTLERGEAHFAVKKNPARPFIVRAQGVDLRAVGTSFNVRVNADSTAVEVLVTEGRVQLDKPLVEPAPLVAGSEAASVSPTAISAAPPPPILEARQRAVISLRTAAATVAPQIDTLTPGEIERMLAWQHRTIDFDATPLNEAVAELNRRNAVQLVLIDPELSSIRVSAKIRSDNIEGFIRSLEIGFGVRAERRGEREIALRAAR